MKYACIWISWRGTLYIISRTDFLPGENIDVSFGAHQNRGMNWGKAKRCLASRDRVSQRRRNVDILRYIPAEGGMGKLCAWVVISLFHPQNSLCPENGIPEWFSLSRTIDGPPVIDRRGGGHRNWIGKEEKKRSVFFSDGDTFRCSMEDMKNVLSCILAEDDPAGSNISLVWNDCAFFIGFFDGLEIRISESSIT